MTQESSSASLPPEEQLEAIHAMLSAGHHGIRLERHSLALWGITGALLILATPRLITEARFPVRWQAATVELLFLASVLGVVSALDFRLTRRIRRLRNESISFVERQIGKVWLLLMGLGLMASFGMHFYGGGAMVYVLWMLLVGIGLFTHGLFSQQFLEWFGGAIILLCGGAIALRLPPDATRWLAVVVFGAGLPALGLSLHGLERWSSPLRFASLVVWLAVAVGTGFAAHTGFAAQRDVMAPAPRAPALTLDELRNQPTSAGVEVVRLPPGTVVPIQISLQGDLFAQRGTFTVPLELTRQLDLVLVDGELDGRFRVDGGTWKTYRSAVSFTKARLRADLTRAERFRVEYTAEVATRR